MRKKDGELKHFLFERMYRHYRVNRMTAKVRRVVRDLFEQYVAQPECLPDEWREAADAPSTHAVVPGTSSSFDLPQTTPTTHTPACS